MRRFRLVGSVALAALSATAFGAASAASALAARVEGAGAPLALASAPGASPLVSAAPAVLAVTPDEGASAGGTKVTLTGERFAGATTVAFGASVVTLKKPSKSQTTIKVVAPPGAGTGAVDVTVTTPEGTSETTPADRFTYTSSPPAIGKLNPNHGPAVGGKAISIGGESFSGATAVRFGTQSVPFTVKSAKVINATVPAATSLGAVDVTVTTPEGTSEVVPADRYTYEAELPAVEGLSPGSGPATGGTAVSVKGEGFIGASKVTFDGTPATSFEVLDDAEIVAVAPPGTVRKVSIQVTTPEGTSPATCPGSTCKPVPKYEYDHPTVASVEPKSGPLAGGTPITITGTGFAIGNGGQMLIQVGKAYATSVHCSSITTCTAVTAAEKKAGPKPVIVRMRTNVNEASEANAEATFTYE